MTTRMAVLGLGLLFAVGACGDDGPELAPSQTRISSDAIVNASVGFAFSVNGTLVAVSPDTVTSLVVSVTEIEYLPVGEDDTEGEEGEGGWVSLELPAAVELDLMDLPTEAEGSIEIGSGSVPVGTYKKVRLLVGSGEIVFNGPISVGGIDFAAATPHPVTIPSGDQTGIKTDVSFEVTAGEGEVENAAYIVFVEGTTFQNVTATGSGRINLTPVLRSK